MGRDLRSTTVSLCVVSVVDDVIQAQRDWAAAIVSNDADRIASHQRPDWAIVTKNGITDSAVFLDVIRAGVLSHSRMEPVGEPLVGVFGEAAVLTVRVHSTETHAGRTIDNDEWATTVFVRQQGHWLAARTQLTTAS
jgi:ketosteroid isomerase-like protein